MSNNENTLTLVQEIFFDLCDLMESNDLDQTIDGFDDQYKDLREFIAEQKRKLAEIENRIEGANT